MANIILKKHTFRWLSLLCTYNFCRYFLQWRYTFARRSRTTT